MTPSFQNEPFSFSGLKFARWRVFLFQLGEDREKRQGRLRRRCLHPPGRRYRKEPYLRLPVPGPDSLKKAADFTSALLKSQIAKS